jgi:hypothetical protein
MVQLVLSLPFSGGNAAKIKKYIKAQTKKTEILEKFG